MQNPCPLCNEQNTQLHHEDTVRCYLICPHCKLVFVPQRYHLDTASEKAIYDLHQNNPDDSGYRKFLNKLITPLLSTLKNYQFPASAHGLDFGSGPGPTLSVMLAEQGLQMSIFDIFYANEATTLKRQYDFITSTEVWEHLSKPKEVIHNIFDLGKEKCVIGIMTKRIPATPFGNWHYIKDPTHISFYADETLEYIARKYKCELHLPESDTAIFIRH